MNDKDKEAMLDSIIKLQGEYVYPKNMYELEFIWYEACEWKQREVDEYKEAARSEAQLVNELQAENAKLRDELETLKDAFKKVLKELEKK